MQENTTGVRDLWLEDMAKSDLSTLITVLKYKVFLDGSSIWPANRLCLRLLGSRRWTSAGLPVNTSRDWSAPEYICIDDLPGLWETACALLATTKARRYTSSPWCSENVCWARVGTDILYCNCTFPINKITTRDLEVVWNYLMQPCCKSILPLISSES